MVLMELVVRVQEDVTPVNPRILASNVKRDISRTWTQVHVLSATKVVPVVMAECVLDVKKTDTLLGMMMELMEDASLNAQLDTSPVKHPKHVKDATPIWKDVLSVPQEMSVTPVKIASS